MIKLKMTIFRFRNTLKKRWNPLTRGGASVNPSLIGSFVVIVRVP
jgi:hypothetical protein